MTFSPPLPRGDGICQAILLLDRQVRELPTHRKAAGGMSRSVAWFSTVVHCHDQQALAKFCRKVLSYLIVSGTRER